MGRPWKVDQSDQTSVTVKPNPVITHKNSFMILLCCSSQHSRHNDMLYSCNYLHNCCTCIHVVYSWLHVVVQHTPQHVHPGEQDNGEDWPGIARWYEGVILIYFSQNPAYTYMHWFLCEFHTTCYKDFDVNSTYTSVQLCVHVKAI